ncbi:MAG TPA: DegT/DnrJ/EryC1/StrS family aminotransferase [Solirubrobacterales bacterium]|nr:DegT/DnrJ/EryC1/StrS family aminotransferase [Solirubrobacterales bacterium]
MNGRTSKHGIPRSVPLASPRLLESELQEAMDAYRSGWLCMGPRTAELEASMCAYTGSGHAIAVSSCTAALHIACLAAGLGPGDSAIVPSLAFAATANAIAYTGATPRFAEIAALDRPWLSVDATEAALEPSTRAIVAMSYGGHPGEIEGLAALAEQRGLVLIEDAAHASGSWLGGRHVGTFGLAGALSFSASKNLGIGEGGMLLTDDERVAQRARELRWHGISASTWDRHRDAAPEYTIGELGFNYRIDDPRAALANARLRRLDEDNRRRAQIEAEYRAAFAGAESFVAVQEPPPGERASHCVFAIVLDEDLDRRRFREHLSRRGVETSVHFPALHRTAVHGSSGTELPLTEAFADRAVSLPIFPHMEDWQCELVVEATLDAATSGREEAAAARRPSRSAVAG